MTKKDYLIAALVGFLTALFTLPTLWNLKIIHNPLVFFVLILIIPLWVFGVWLGGFLSRWFAFFTQFGKFVTVGFLNTAIDFGILNLLIFLFSVSSGILFSIFKSVSFIAAVTNSYFWNKFWTFHAKGKIQTQEYAQFFVVSLVGLVINVGTASFIVNFIGPQFGLNPTLWANLAAIASAAFNLTWNFVGYKFIVFKNHL